MQGPPDNSSSGRFSLTFLAEASQILSRSLDPQATVAEVARLHVPLIADACAVDLQDSGVWRRQAVAHVDERLQQQMWQCGEALWAGPVPEGLDVLVTEGELAHVVRLEQDDAAPGAALAVHCGGAGAKACQEGVAEATTARHRLLCALACMPNSGAHTALAVPLVAGSRTFGIMTLTCCSPERRFTAEDMALAAELARRAATALDNARLYRDAERLRAEAEAARSRSQFLSHASETLARTVQYDDVVQAAAQLAVEHLSPCCLVDLEPRANARVWAIAHSDPAQAAAMRRVIDADRNALQAPDGAARTGDKLQTASARRAAQQFWSQFAGQPKLTLPLLVRDAVHGQVTLVRTGPAAPSFDSETKNLAEAFLGRVAGAIDRAWLFNEMQSAVAMRDEFLSIASHELRTPLTALELQLGNLQRLLLKGDAVALKTRFVDKLERATRQTTRLAKLIDNLLDVSRISAGRFRLECETFDLTTLCRDLAERWSEEAAVANCPIAFTGEAICQGMWDPLRIEQVMTNLLSNAVKYGAGQPIHVIVGPTESGVCLRVEDHGIGVAPAALKRIFDRFERAVSPREFGGLGLGLFISREIVQAHGGRISVDSELGAGATFLVELPWQAPASAKHQTLDIGRDLMP